MPFSWGLSHIKGAQRQHQLALSSCYHHTLCFEAEKTEVQTGGPSHSDHRAGAGAWLLELCSWPPPLLQSDQPLHLSPPPASCSLPPHPSHPHPQFIFFPFRVLSTEVLKGLSDPLISLEEASVVAQVMAVHLSLLAELMETAEPRWE